jgi:ABC-type multidrug transport system fused ATPase/permease subunit
MTGAHHRRLRALSILLGRRGFSWMAISMSATVAQALMENLMVVALILLAYALGMLDRTRLPIWLPHQLADWGTSMVLVSLVLLGLVRSGTQATAACAQHAVLEWVRARIQHLQGYRMLMLPALPPVALSEAHLMMGDHLNKATNWCFHGVQLVSSALMAVSFLLALFWLAWKNALLASACLIVLGLLVRGQNRAILALAAHIPRHRALLEQALVRISRNRVLIRVMDLQETERRHFDDSVSDYFRSSCRTFWLRDIAGALLPLLGILVIAFMVGINVKFIHTPPVTLMGSIYLFLAITRRMASVVDNAGGMMQTQIPFDRAVDLVLSMDESHRVRALQRTQTGIREPHKPPRSTAPPPAITLRGVGFRWPGARSPIFEGLDLHIPAGGRFGIVGPNGSGKTTLLHLILGLEEPQAGEILVGGIPARDYAVLGGPVSYVGTENLLILGSVRENLVYGVAGHVEDADLRRALDQVGLGPWVDGLAKGLDHRIGENEEGLSAGQKQRLSLARALLRNPSLLVLDEASANIDSRSELEVTSLLETITPTCTILIVSHKPGILTGISHRLELPEPLYD